MSERKEALIFIGLAATGLISSFLGLNLLQEHSGVDRRLVLCGYSTSELIVSKLVVLLCVILITGVYVASMILVSFQPRHFLQMISGFILGGFVYGCYGLLVGTIFKKELEGILFIVLLANIDAGWLQNPIYYAEAQNKAIIRSLPAYFPSQASMAAAFTDHSVINPLMRGIIYGIVLLFVALFIYWRRMGIRK
ncbi:MAG: ABC transporter permease [Thermodesulfovibrionales bacterium]